jgi:hypothetical protein
MFWSLEAEPVSLFSAFLEQCQMEGQRPLSPGTVTQFTSCLLAFGSGDECLVYNVSTSPTQGFGLTQLLSKPSGKPMDWLNTTTDRAISDWSREKVCAQAWQ